MEVTHPDVQKLADAAQAFAFGWFARLPKNRFKVVVGTVGTGKSRAAKHLHRWAAAVAYEAWQGQWKGGSTPSVVRVDWSAVGSPDTCEQSDWEAWLRDVEAASMVILDDLGTETDRFKTNIPTERLCHVLNRCDGKYVWINTNVEPAAWATRWDARAEDRLLAGQLVEVQAPSYRSEIPHPHPNLNRTNQ